MKAVGLLVVAAAVAASAARADDDDSLGECTGGDTTVYAAGRSAFSFALATLSDAERQRMMDGAALHRPLVRRLPPAGPWPTAPAGGTEPAVALLLRLSVPGTGPHGGVVPEPAYGDQFDNAAIPGVRPEGRVTLTLQPRAGRLADGTRFTLLKPRYGVADQAARPWCGSSNPCKCAGAVPRTMRIITTGSPKCAVTPKCWSTSMLSSRTN